MDKKIIAPILITFVVAGGLGYWIGSNYGASGKQVNQGGQFGAGQNRAIGQGQGQNTPRTAGQGRGEQGAGFVNGEILSATDKNLTIKMRDGGSKIVLMASSTQVTKSDAGSITDLAIGKQVMVNGSTNSDGSVTASFIQIRPSDMPLGWSR